VADYENMMDSFEKFGEPEGITIPNADRIIPILADIEDPEFYGPPV
jgi:hypothetical protein